MMRRRSRTRWVLKWSATVLCVAIVVMGAFSARWGLYLFTDNLERCVGLARGAVFVGWLDSKHNPSTCLITVRYEYRPRAQYLLIGHGRGLSWGVYPKIHFSVLPNRLPKSPFTVIVHDCLAMPMWIVLASILVPTIVLWRQNRHIPHSHCQNCGYNLTGNVSGRCPECGTAVEAV